MSRAGRRDRQQRKLRGPKASRLLEIFTGMRFCAECGAHKPLDDFPMTTTKSSDGSKSWSYPRVQCITCFTAIKSRQYAAKRLQRSYLSSCSAAKRRGATQFLSFDEWRALNAVTACHWCSMSLQRSFTQFDHVLPLSRGGQHTADNLVASCANCNMSRLWEMQTKYKEDR